MEPNMSILAKGQLRPDLEWRKKARQGRPPTRLENLEIWWDFQGHTEYSPVYRPENKDNCWVWIGKVSYARFGKAKPVMRVIWGTSRSVRKWLYELFVEGDVISQRYTVRNTCGRSDCYNPYHSLKVDKRTQHDTALNEESERQLAFAKGESLINIELKERYPRGHHYYSAWLEGWMAYFGKRDPRPLIPAYADYHVEEAYRVKQLLQQAKDEGVVPWVPLNAEHGDAVVNAMSKSGPFDPFWKIVVDMERHYQKRLDD